MYLHDAIRLVIEEHNNLPMRVQDIATIINQRGLYIKKDGSQVNARQVGWRAIGDISKGDPPQFDVLIKLR